MRQIEFNSLSYLRRLLAQIRLLSVASPNQKIRMPTGPHHCAVLHTVGAEPLSRNWMKKIKAMRVILTRRRYERHVVEC